MYYICNFLVQSLQYSKEKENVAHENIKKFPQKLLSIGPIFLFTTAN